MELVKQWGPMSLELSPEGCAGFSALEFGLLGGGSERGSPEFLLSHRLAADGHRCSSGKLRMVAAAAGDITSGGPRAPRAFHQWQLARLQSQ